MIGQSEQAADKLARVDVNTPSEGTLAKAMDTAKGVKDFAADKLGDVRDVAEQKAEDLVAFMKARPVESVLASLALGYLLGWLAGKATHRLARCR